MSYLGNEPPQIAGYSTQTKAAPVGSSITLNQEGTVNSTLLFLDGVRQTPTTDYTISGTTLTLTSTAPTTAVATILFLGDVADIGVPSDDTVNVDQLDTDSAGSTGQFLKKSGASAIDWATVDALPSQTSQSGKFLTTDGSAASWATAGGGGLAGVQVYTADGTWTKSTRESALGVTITKLIVEVQGGGGSGSRHDSSDANNCAGGGGGYAKKLIDASSITSSTITVGIGGAGQASNNNAGSDGGISKWEDGTNTLIGNPGIGGNLTSNVGAEGGTASGGDINIYGGVGAVQISGQRAGASVLGIPGPSLNNSSLTGGRGYGAGGGSGRSTTSGAGAPGVCIVWEYE